jgi:hypothetical protein
MTLILPQQYADLGFQLYNLGNYYLVLARNEKVVFVFDSCICAGDDFVSQLCKNYLNLAPGENN